MREIGGYIELDTYHLPMLHEGAVALNSGRNCLAYLIQVNKIKKILLPYYLCNSVRDICKRENVEISYYSIDNVFRPINVSLQDDEWLYIVNYYGQLDNKYLEQTKKEHNRVIVDNAQAYFQMPIENTDTLYTCRKFFGVADGAFLYTQKTLDEELLPDESFERMRFLLGRYERTASEFYKEYTDNNRLFGNQPIKTMSKLTMNLLHGIDYAVVKERRTRNFSVLHNQFKNMNKLQLTIPEGAFMYPLYVVNGAEIRKKLQEKKIYIPTLWPDVFGYCTETQMEYDMAKNILPIPIDQRYNTDDMLYITDEVIRSVN